METKEIKRYDCIFCNEPMLPIRKDTNLFGYVCKQCGHEFKLEALEARENNLKTGNQKRSSKYKNSKMEYDGIVFDSIKEANMYKSLKAMEKMGLVRDLELQKVFELQPGFKNAKGKKVRPITYLADFVYYDIEEDRKKVVDCKGFRTQVYKIKRKMFDYVYKDEGTSLEESI